MQRYQGAGGAQNPGFLYKVQANLTILNDRAWFNWLDEYPDSSRYYINHRWNLQDENIEIQFESEQAAIMFALQWL